MENLQEQLYCVLSEWTLARGELDFRALGRNARRGLYHRLSGEAHLEKTAPGAVGVFDLLFCKSGVCGFSGAGFKYDVRYVPTDLLRRDRSADGGDRRIFSWQRMELSVRSRAGSFERPEKLWPFCAVYGSGALSCVCGKERSGTGGEQSFQNWRSPCRRNNVFVFCRVALGGQLLPVF